MASPALLSSPLLFLFLFFALPPCLLPSVLSCFPSTVCLNFVQVKKDLEVFSTLQTFHGIPKRHLRNVTLDGLFILRLLLRFPPILAGKRGYQQPSKMRFLRFRLSHAIKVEIMLKEDNGWFPVTRRTEMSSSEFPQNVLLPTQKKCSTSQYGARFSPNSEDDFSLLPLRFVCFCFDPLHLQLR